PLQERSNVPVQLVFDGVCSAGVAHVVQSVTGCTPVNALPTPSTTCTISTEKDVTISVDFAASGTG
ncbi:MAG TPA: hypothetical protein VK425_07305, partial [Acidimicrobiales bacterium]|nr:hypothetical protein [Acidimicrobiales bacterium]